MKRTLTKTADGSFTLYVLEIDEHYHSIHGALQEAEHVFIQNGVDRFKHQKVVHVLELGLGTALNAYLTYVWAEKHAVKVSYVGIEAFPLEPGIVRKCLEVLGEDNLKVLDFFEHLRFEETQSLGHFFEITPRNCKWQDTVYLEKFDVVYYDAFGPRAQEELWTLENFNIAYQALKTGGILSTYCAKGQVKRDLKSVGFFVETLPGPPGKREMVVAVKTVISA